MLVAASAPEDGDRLPGGDRRRRRLWAAALLAAVAGVAALAAVLARSDGPGPPRVGVVSGTDLPLDARASGDLGARVARVAFPIGTAVEELREAVAAHADRGVALLPLAVFPDGRLPSAEEARSLRAWADEFGPGGRFWARRDDGELAVRNIEFGNETSYPAGGVADRAGEYALLAREAHAALSDAPRDRRVGLLVQADDADAGSGWVDGMLAAVPDLGDRVAGWTVHPYGPSYRQRVQRVVAQTRANGAPDDVPIFVTEWGLASDDGACLDPDNYGWDPCMSYAKAALTLRRVVAALERDLGARLAAFFVYNARDLAPPGATREREHYFGALRLDRSAKGEYTEEVRRQLARSPDPER